MGFAKERATPVWADWKSTPLDCWEAQQRGNLRQFHPHPCRRLGLHLPPRPIHHPHSQPSGLDLAHSRPELPALYRLSSFQLHQPFAHHRPSLIQQLHSQPRIRRLPLRGRLGLGRWLGQGVDLLSLDHLRLTPSLRVGAIRPQSPLGLCWGTPRAAGARSSQASALTGNSHSRACVSCRISSIARARRSLGKHPTA